MKYYLILFLLCFPVQAEYYIGVGIGKNDILFGDQEWQDNGEVGCAFRAGYRHHMLVGNLKFTNILNYLLVRF